MARFSMAVHGMRSRWCRLTIGKGCTALFFLTHHLHLPPNFNNLFLGPQAARLHTRTAGASALLALRARVQAGRLRSQFGLRWPLPWPCLGLILLCGSRVP